MKKIKIKFEDWWPDFHLEDNFITKILSKHFEVAISDDPDFVFASVFGFRTLQYDAVRICYTGENIIPDFSVYDYGIGFGRLAFGDRYLRFPLYHLRYDSPDKLSSRRNVAEDEWQSRRFCATVVSNPGAWERNDFFDLLCRRKSCDSGGRHANNLPGGVPVADKIAFLNNYRFSMAFENASNPGYVTEKIADSFCAGTIPVYWGALDVGTDFNPAAFINCHHYRSFDDVIDRMLYLEEHPEEALAMMREPVFTKEQEKRFVRDWEELEAFLLRICRQEGRAAYRRNSLGAGHARTHENHMKILSLVLSELES